MPWKVKKVQNPFLNLHSLIFDYLILVFSGYHGYFGDVHALRFRISWSWKCSTWECHKQFDKKCPRSLWVWLIKYKYKLKNFKNSYFGYRLLGLRLGFCLWWPTRMVFFGIHWWKRIFQHSIYRSLSHHWWWWI